MSRWVDVLNQLRHGASGGRFVGAQETAAAVLVGLLRSHDVVNLHGPPGSGKTYLGWVLARVTGARHFASLSRLTGRSTTQPGPGVRSPGGGGSWTRADLADVAIMDNSPATRLGARGVVADARSADYRRIVLVTRDPIPDHVPRVRLELGHAEIEAIARALAALGWASPAGVAEAPSLWARIWGDSDETDGSSTADTIPGTTITHA